MCATDQALRESIKEYSRIRQLIRTRSVEEDFPLRAEELNQQNVQRTEDLMEQHPLAPLLIEK